MPMSLRSSFRLRSWFRTTKRTRCWYLLIVHQKTLPNYLCAYQQCKNCHLPCFKNFCNPTQQFGSIPLFSLQKHIFCISIHSMDFVPKNSSFFGPNHKSIYPTLFHEPLEPEFDPFTCRPSSSDGIDPPAFLEKRGNKRHLEKQNLGNTKHSDLKKKNGEKPKPWKYPP